MTFTIRFAQRADYEPVVGLFALADPAYVAHAQLVWRLAEEQAEDASVTFRHWVAVEDVTQQIIGYAALWNERRRKFRMNLLVHPDWRRRGIGSCLFKTLLTELQTTPASSLQARTRDDWEETLAFLSRRGFVEIHRMYELRLNIAEANLASFASLPVQLQEAGIEITTFEREEAAGEQCWAKLLDLQNVALRDWPDPDPDGLPTIFTEDEFKRVFASWEMIPAAFYIAKMGEQYIGYSGLGVEMRALETVRSGPTAVRPAQRGRCVATALKVLCLQYAWQHGYKFAKTNSANPAMIRVNEKVGFERGRAEVRLVRRLDAQPQ